MFCYIAIQNDQQCTLKEALKLKSVRRNNNLIFTSVYHTQVNENFRPIFKFTNKQFFTMKDLRDRHICERFDRSVATVLNCKRKTCTTKLDS